MREEFDIKEFFKFTYAAIAATENCNKAEFECPLCGATAVAVKADNNHVHAVCDKCEANFME